MRSRLLWRSPGWPALRWLNATYQGVAGSTNNNTTLNLQGTGLPIPPPPGKTTTNVLSASPASPQLDGERR